MSVYGTSASADSSYIYAVVTFVSIALYNVIELTVIIFVTFKKRAGLYFWSFCIATWGIVPYSTGFLLKGLNVNPAAIYAYVTLIVVGWYCTVTGQSVVLYSRLHLVDRNARHLHFVRAMIITNGVILHSVTTVMVYGANSSSDPSRFFRPYSIVEKIQVTIFFVQELTISGLYILATIKFFHDSAIHTKSARTRMLRRLITVNIVVILLDITILGLEYADFYQLQTAYKAMAYSLKLKLEFKILNDLVHLTRCHADSEAGGLNDHISDGTRRGYAIDSTGQSMAFGNVNTHGLDSSRQYTMPGMRAQMRNESYVEATSSPGETADGPHRAPYDSILITRTIDVDVVRDMEFERLMRAMGRIETGGSGSGGGMHISIPDSHHVGVTSERASV